MTVAQSLRIDQKLHELTAILQGMGTEADLLELNNEWDIEQRLKDAFTYWQIPHIEYHCLMSMLSGGEKTKVFLAGMSMCSSAVMLMDEPTNHLDKPSRQLLYEYIRHSDHTMFIVSHDRTLLNLLHAIYELKANEIRFYPMNYDAYKHIVDKENQT